MIATNPARTLVYFASATLAVVLSVWSVWEGQPSPIRVAIDRKNPPTFSFSGNGQVSSIIVTDVSANELSGFDPKRIMWEIVSDGEAKPSRFPLITYGTVPRAFVQRIPASGPPPPLEEERLYRVAATTAGADSQRLIFLIHNDQALSLKMADVMEWYVR